MPLAAGVKSGHLSLFESLDSTFNSEAAFWSQGLLYNYVPSTCDCFPASMMYDIGLARLGGLRR
jgi:hypothetical protein